MRNRSLFYNLCVTLIISGFLSGCSNEGETSNTALARLLLGQSLDQTMQATGITLQLSVEGVSESTFSLPLENRNSTKFVRVLSDMPNSLVTKILIRDDITIFENNNQIIELSVDEVNDFEIDLNGIERKILLNQTTLTTNSPEEIQTVMADDDDSPVRNFMMQIPTVILGEHSAILTLPVTAANAA